MPGAERHSGARKWRACSHRAPKKQTKGDGRAAKGQYGNDAAERNARKQAASGRKRRRGWWRRPSSSMASCGWPAARFVVVWWRAWRWWRR
ncbi:hypothetical protein PR002_g24480 [Phytophthora rubi]|uniref:Uncharacterized protein n=1 Tax=Phytophthora rubi TaxID=129364 RepID=A0A6A3IGG8_9STRA|nr:hypothetical protein PR002_g24480 [Phytophthora rubi]